MKKHLIKALLFLSPASVFMSCDPIHKFTEGHAPLSEQIRELSVDSLSYPVNALDIYSGSELIHTYTADSSHNFYLPERTSQITSFPCSSCHTEPVEVLKKKQGEGKEAHWDIKIEHASSEVMACNTCHGDSMTDQLVSLNNNPLNYNESFKLCMQCHSTQYKDWLGGAHGKSLGGWVEPRIMNSCVNCHNPHSPAFESRWPARLNTIKLKEQTSK